MPTEWSDEIVVAELADEPALSDELGALIERLEDERIRRHVVLNFAGVSYMNSSNLAQLLKLREILATEERGLRLCGINDEIWSVLLVTGLDKVFRFAPDPMTALAGLQLKEGESGG